MHFPFVGKECYVAGEFKVCEDRNGTFRITFTPKDGGDTAELYATRRNDKGGDCRFVSGSAFVPDSMIGSGIGTKLYEAGMRAAQRAGCKYGSSDNRSVFSEAFWKKQQRKGRATCVRGEPASYYAPPYEDIKYKCDRGRLPEKVCDRVLKVELPDDYDSGYGGSWDCNHYLLKTPMPSSLGKLKKRRK